MEFDLLTIMVAAVALMLAAYAAWRRGSLSVEGIAEGLTVFQAVVAEAKHLVFAAEQLWRTRKLEKDQRFYWVLSRLRNVFPDLDDDLLKTSIESAVGWMNLARDTSE